MRRVQLLCSVLVMAFGAVAPNLCTASPNLQVEGRWKLVLLIYGEDHFATVDLKDEATGTVVASSPQVLPNASIDEVTVDGDKVSFTLKSEVGTSVFKGRAYNDGPFAGMVLGAFNFRDQWYPARLEQTESTEMEPLSAPGDLLKSILELQREADLATRVTKLEEIIRQNSDAPAASRAFAALFQAAGEAGLSEEKVSELAELWLDSARPYGAEWVGQTYMAIVESLPATEDFGQLTLTVAELAEADLGENATAEQRSTIAKRIASAAELVGNTELAATATERVRELEALLDEEYRKSVPPFEPSEFAGRNDDSSRVVLMELFTGAQCPPCVAADVAFDALQESFEPTELVLLQYHLHIPGPDPLTNPDSIARQQYYGSVIRGTPTTLFNGNAQAPGGGGMSNAESKYTQYRQVIEEGLKGEQQATIDLSASLTGETINIAVKAAVENAESPKLRLVLVEDTIQYVGNNDLRFHHQVVRALLGGSEGLALNEGTLEDELTVDLNDVRSDIESYVDEYQQQRSFPGELPSVDLEGLKIVAFVQDDATKEVLHAAVAPLDSANE